MTVDITCVNDAPVADDETITTTEDTAVNTPVATLLAGDTDVDGDTLTVTAVSGAVGGTAVLNDNGTPQHGRRLRALHAGRQPVRRGAGATTTPSPTAALTDIGRVTVNITCVNDAPVVAVSGNFTAVNEGITRTFTYTVSDVDSESWTVEESCGSNAPLHRGRRLE